MFLSIIIPTYNDEKYLDECLGSCLAQDIDDYEIICVDDGSTDRTPQMLDEYAVKYPRISVIHKEHGVGYGRNIGMARAKGDYLWFVDHDDLIEENCLGYFKAVVKKTGCERLEFPFFEFDLALTTEDIRLKQEGKLPPMTKRMRVYVWTSITQRAFLLKNSIWPHSIHLGDRIASFGVDTLYVKECIKAAPVVTTLTDRPYYYYRQSPSQSIRNYSEESILHKINSFISFSQMHRELYENALSEGRCTFDDALDYVLSVRDCINQYLSSNKKYRKVFMQKLKESNLFPLELPKIYTDTYSCKDCIRAKNGMGPIQSIAYYHCTCPWGLRLYWLTNWRAHYARFIASKPLRNLRQFLMTHQLTLRKKG